MITRIITGLFLLGIGITLINTGGIGFFLWVFLVTILSAYEMIMMAKKSGVQIYSSFALGVIAIAMLSVLYPPCLVIWKSFPMRLFVWGMVCFSFFELARKILFFPKTPVFATARIVLFVLATFPYMFLLREGHQGFHHFLFSVALIWSGDIAALFGGKWLGRHPLSDVSPKKTVEGSIIGFMGSMVFAGIFIRAFHFGSIYWALGALVAVVGQLGDLHESLVKRHFGVKDSSQLLPGHGGFYDRADSTLFVSPFMYFFFN